MATQIKLRRGTAAQWTESNPTLAAGEAGFETDTNQLKIGNGAADWATLDYISSDLTPYATLESPTFTGTVQVDGVLEVAGNLNVSGSVTTISSQDLVLEDSLIYLAEGNTSDIIDIGIVGSFTASSSYQHAGLVRDASDGKWKLFSSVEDEPTTTVNFDQAAYDPLKVGSFEALTVSAETATFQGLTVNGTDLSTSLDSKLNKTVSIIQTNANSYTPQLSDAGKLIELNGSNENVISVPTNNSVPFPIGTQLNFIQVTSFVGVIIPQGGVTVNATPGLNFRTQWSSVTLIKRGTDSWVAIGDLVA